MTALLVHGIFGPHESATRQHPGQFIRYCGAHRCVQTRGATIVAIGHIIYTIRWMWPEK